MSDVVKVKDVDSLRELIDSEDRVVIKFTAPSWCAPCRQFAPHFETAAESASIRSDHLGRTTFVSVDIDNVTDADVVYGIKSVPTVMLYENGQYIKNIQSRTAVKLLNELS